MIFNAEIQDLFAYHILHIAKKIAKCLPEEGSVLFTGGAYNTFGGGHSKKEPKQNSGRPPRYCRL